LKEESYELIVIDRFHFCDGRTVFLGLVDGRTEPIPAGFCDLQIRGQKKATIRIDGEEVVETKQAGPYRAVSTTEQVAIDSPFVSGEWKLVFGQ
jgi:hypothetical protein